LIGVVRVKLSAAASKKKPSDAVAIVSFDEKPGIQAIASTAPDLPPEPGGNATLARDHEYKRHGTVSLLAGIERELAAQNPAAYRLDLAATLTNRGVLYYDTQHFAAAEAAYSEAAGIRRELATQNPAAYRTPRRRRESCRGRGAGRREVAHGGFRREVQPVDSIGSSSESRFPFQIPAFGSFARGRRRLGEKKYRAPSVDAGGCTSRRNSGTPLYEVE
jgi:hypothetical protein